MPNFYSPYQPNYYQPQQPQPQIQNGGFVSVRNEAEARNYPIAIGTSVTFKDENAPYIYNKTMGFSQLDAPRFDKYRLVKEDTTEDQNVISNDPPADNTIDELRNEIKDIWAEIENIKRKSGKTTPKKKEVVEDDPE